MIVRLANQNFKGELNIFSGVKGLVSHGNELKEYLEKNRPELLLISISREEVKGLEEFLKAPFEMNLSDYEIIYGVRLSRYGDVMTPPPIYTESIMFSTSTGAEARGIDINQPEFDKLYTESMKTRHLIRHSIRKKRVLNHDFGDTNEYEFAENWIRRINAVKGLASIDRERVRTMEEQILSFAANDFRQNHLVIIDHEFFKPLIEKLEADGWQIRNA